MRQEEEGSASQEEEDTGDEMETNIIPECVLDESGDEEPIPKVTMNFNLINENFDNFKKKNYYRNL